MKRKLIALAADRKAALDAAEVALNAGNQEECKSQMEKAANILAEINQVKDLIAEQERQILTAQPSAAETRDMMSERGNDLLNRRSVKLSSAEVMRELRNAVTITGTLVQPTGADSQIHGEGAPITSILDMVQVQDLSGLGGGYEVPYLISEFDATLGNLTTNSGQARANSADPTFGISVIKPVELTTTSYVDRNLAKITPANYYERVHQMAIRALRRKAAALIVNGDGNNTPAMYGIKNATNKAGSTIIKTGTYAAIDVNTLDELYFAYGANTEMAGSAVLQLTKADLKAIGQLRGTNEKRRLFEITPQGNGNTGMISDGGVQIPYVLEPDLSAGELLYGNPMHYLLGLFGDYEIRIDESVKAIERMHTILGDAAIGGNVVEHQGFVYYSKASGNPG